MPINPHGETFPISFCLISCPYNNTHLRQCGTRHSGCLGDPRVAQTYYYYPGEGGSHPTSPIPPPTSLARAIYIVSQTFLLNGISCICYKVENNHIWPTYKFRTSITNTKMFVEEQGGVTKVVTMINMILLGKTLSVLWRLLISPTTNAQF